MNKDCNFPIIEYPPNLTSSQWGMAHGESYRDSIKELYLIRKELMLKRNPGLISNLKELAQEQFLVSKIFCTDLGQELEGIARGANLEIEDIIILNNYTDFRDIILNEEGCSTVHINNKPENISGQTWDMHASAKEYLCVLKVPWPQGEGNLLVLSLVGCLGISGVNSNNLFIGVNNLNTKNAELGMVWPLLIRKCLEQKNFKDLENVLINAPITSGHSYLISSPLEAALWEISPKKKELVGRNKTGEKGNLIHTNHCLNEELKK